MFVHSKVVTIDDAWATVGSANLDGVSLHSYGDDFAGRLGRRVFRHVRNFDVNAVIDARAGMELGSEVVRDLRVRLWCEHLGVGPSSVGERPARGWLQYWHERAAGNVQALNEPRSGAADAQLRAAVQHPCDPARQLADLGVRLTIAGSRCSFNPGWLEVHCSPNWVRNMFS